MSVEIAPGSILQRMHFKHRLRQFGPPGRFIEVGAGSGQLSRLLLERGYHGEAFDLNADACQSNRALNQAFIESGTYTVRHADFFDASDLAPADLILSSMVIEHLDEDQVDHYFERCKQLLRPGGRIVTFVPASMKYWNIEDEIAGHFRRYEVETFEALAARHRLAIGHIAGLTYPLSNILFGLSNRLVQKNEAGKKDLSMAERTVLSGKRDVKYKTAFPAYFRLFLNEITLYPFFLLQELFSHREDCMILYCEMLPEPVPEPALSSPE